MLCVNEDLRLSLWGLIKLLLKGSMFDCTYVLENNLNALRLSVSILSGFCKWSCPA